MVSTLELSANAVNAASILLAARNSLHTWWLGIVGCCLFALLFFESRLYADTALQIFFITTSAVGWWQWRSGRGETATLPITHVPGKSLVLIVLVSIATACGYGYLLRRF